MTIDKTPCRCACREGFTLQEDDNSCKASRDVVTIAEAEPAYRPKPELRRLVKTVDTLEEKFRALNSAIKLYSFAGGDNAA